MSTGRRLDRIERHLPRSPPLDHAALDAEIEALAAELDAREGAGASAALLAQIEAEMAPGRVDQSA